MIINVYCSVSQFVCGEGFVHRFLSEAGMVGLHRLYRIIIIIINIIRKQFTLQYNSNTNFSIDNVRILSTAALILESTFDNLVFTSYLPTPRLGINDITMCFGRMVSLLHVLHDLNE